MFTNFEKPKKTGVGLGRGIPPPFESTIAYTILHDIDPLFFRSRVEQKLVYTIKNYSKIYPI